MKKPIIPLDMLIRICVLAGVIVIMHIIIRSFVHMDLAQELLTVGVEEFLRKLAG